MHDFVVLYRGREGSSPLISALGKHPLVHVPLFETLDFYTARQFADAGTIASYVDRVLVGEDIQRGATPIAKGLPEAQRGSRAIGFKWRIWGDPAPVAAVLLRRRPVVFHLFRRNLLELAASLYFSNTVVPALEAAEGIDLAGGGHMQFKILKLGPGEREDTLNRIRAVRFTAPPAEIETIAKRILNDKRTKTEIYLDPFSAGGGMVRSITYEDFCTAREGLVAAMAGVIGVDPALQTSFDTYYTKVTGEDFLSQVENLNELRGSDRLAKLTLAYDRLIFERHAYLAPLPEQPPRSPAE